jgi:ribosomal protein L24
MNFLTFDETVELAVQANKAHDEVYGWGIQEQTDTSIFGVAATHGSVIEAVNVIADGIKDESVLEFIERISNAIHIGWSKVALEHPDQTEEQKARRVKLIESPYEDLSEDEKQKDRVIAYALLKFLGSKE